LIVNSLSLIILSPFVFSFPIWATFFYCNKFKKWEDESFQEKYGAALEGMRLDRRSSFGYVLIFMLRRFALVLIVTVFLE